MFEFWRQTGRMFQDGDPRTYVSFGVSILLLLFVVAMFVFGQEWLRLDDQGAIRQIFAKAADSHLALVGVIAAYTLLAMTGFPQIWLFVATVLAFGPQTGGVYAWVGTMVSATLTFFLGHLLGGQWVKRWGGDKVQQSMEYIGRHGILASGLVRVVPSAPFIVVNAAAGAAHIPIWKYWLGTGIGTVPKIALVAIAAAIAPPDVLEHGVSGILGFFQSRHPRDLAIMAVIISAWVAILLGARWMYVRRANQRQKY